MTCAPIIYNNNCYPLPLKFTMTSFCPYEKKKKCCPKKKEKCESPCYSNYGCNSNPYANYLNLCAVPNNIPLFPSIYIFQLVEVSHNNYTFTISTLDLTPKVVAHGTAYQIGNMLFLTFLDDNNAIGNGVIEFENFNYCRQGIVKLQGCIRSILPLFYIVNPLN